MLHLIGSRVSTLSPSHPSRPRWTLPEIMAASHCALELMFVKGLLAEMGVAQDKPILYVDNESAVALAKDRRSCHKSRHIERRYLKVREFVEMGEMDVMHVPTDENPADLFTKELPLVKFAKFVKMVTNGD